MIKYEEGKKNRKLTEWEEKNENDEDEQSSKRTTKASED